MKRATVTLPDDLEHALQAYLNDQEMPSALTAVAQTALRGYLAERGYLPPAHQLKITPAERGSGQRESRPLLHASVRQAVLCDTGPLYAAADPDDQYHARAQRELHQLATQQTTVILAYPTLFEAYALILNRLARATAPRWLKESLSGAALLHPTPDDYRPAAAKLGPYPDQSITLFDATLAVIAGRLAVPVWADDHHFDVIAVAVWR